MSLSLALSKKKARYCVSPRCDVVWMGGRRLGQIYVCLYSVFFIEFSFLDRKEIQKRMHQDMFFKFLYCHVSIP